MKFSALSLAALVGLSQAVEVQVVSVGKNPVNKQAGLKYWPEKITAKPGTMVQFQFLDGNHTVTQSTFDEPCISMNKADSTKQGFLSGFMPFAASAAKGELPVFTIMVNDTKPIWVYCGQGPHCKKGMAMVINENTQANSSRSLENYKKLAEGSAAPGGGAPGGGSTATPGGGSSPTTLAPGGTSPTSGSGGSTSSPRPSPSTPVVAGANSLGTPTSLLVAIGAAFMLL